MLTDPPPLLLPIPTTRQLGKNAPGFLTAVGKAYVENPNPGRQLVEVDHRHLYQADSVASPQQFDQPPTDAERKRADEQAKWEANEWLPQGHVKKRPTAEKKGKSRK
jgi:hypothetical protein